MFNPKLLKVPAPKVEDKTKKNINFELKEDLPENNFYQLRKGVNNKATTNTNNLIESDSDLVKKCEKCKKVLIR